LIQNWVTINVLGSFITQCEDVMSIHALPAIKNEDASERLQQLSDEVSRIATTLARMSSGPFQVGDQVSKHDSGKAAPAISTIKGVIKARRLRARFFDEELFADPAWDILLELLLAEVSQCRVAVSSLCIAAHVPATTALRYISSMTDAGLLRRRSDPTDGRRVFVELTPQASNALHSYFSCLKTVTSI
jgi:DNA-binding MarR family transcriptional regulator